MSSSFFEGCYNRYNLFEVKVIILVLKNIFLFQGSDHGKFALWIKADESEDADADADSFIFQRKWASGKKKK